MCVCVCVGGSLNSSNICACACSSGRVRLHSAHSLLQNKINDSSTLAPEAYGKLGSSPDHGTSHVSVISPTEVMVAATT